MRKEVHSPGELCKAAVIPAKAGIHVHWEAGKKIKMNPRFRGITIDWGNNQR
jgi:hypothetical protein